MRKFLTGCAVVAGVVVASCEPAVAQGLLCDDASKVADQLLRKYNETPVSIGLQSSGNLLQIYASPEGTWTAVSTTPGGMSCIIGVGSAWQSLPDLDRDPVA